MPCFHFPHSPFSLFRSRNSAKAARDRAGPRQLHRVSQMPTHFCLFQVFLIVFFSLICIHLYQVRGNQDARVGVRALHRVLPRDPVLFLCLSPDQAEEHDLGRRGREHGHQERDGRSAKSHGERQRVASTFRSTNVFIASFPSISIFLFVFCFVLFRSLVLDPDPLVSCVVPPVSSSTGATDPHLREEGWRATPHRAVAISPCAAPPSPRPSRKPSSPSRLVP